MGDVRETMELHPDTTNPETLVDRLRGIYRIPIRDGLGPVGAGDEPDNPNEYVRSGFPVAPIQHAAAAEIERLRAEVARLREALQDYRSRYCEGWCGAGGVFDDCGGCAARAALAGEARDGAA